MTRRLMRLSVIAASMLAVFMLCMAAESYADVDVVKDKTFENLFYVYGGNNFKVKCVIDELDMPYYEAAINVDDPEQLEDEIAKQKDAGVKWLKKNTKKEHTYKITFRQYNKVSRKWKTQSKYTIKKKYSRKIKYSIARESDVKAVVYVHVAYSGRDFRFFTTRKFKKNIKYVENDPENEFFYFTKNGKFHWEPSPDDNE